MKKQTKAPLNYKVKISTITIFIISSILFLAAYWRFPNDFAVTLIIFLFGCTIGLLMAMLVTPYGQTDAANLKSFSKIVGSFLTGYVLSKLDKIFETFISEKQYSDELTAVRIILFLCFFLLFWILVFNYRTYVIIDPKDSVSKNQEKIDQINKWKDMLDKNMISEEDYTIEKNKILDE